MLILELFAGTRSIGKVAEKHGHEVFSVENDPSHGCNMTMSVLDFDLSDFIGKHGIPEALCEEVILPLSI